MQTHGASIFAATVISVVLSASAAAQSPGVGTRETAAESPDALFVQQADAGGVAQMELSQLAVQQAQSADVRHLAETIVQDHARDERELATIAAHENIALPKQIDDRHAQLRAQLSIMHGSGFDHAYIEAMLADHATMADLLKSSRATVSTQELRTYITTTLPVVEGHLQMAQTVHFE